MISRLVLFSLLCFCAFGQDNVACPVLECGSNCTSLPLVGFSCSDCWTELQDCLATSQFTSTGETATCQCIVEVGVCLSLLHCQEHLSLLSTECSNFPTCDCGFNFLAPGTGNIPVCASGSFCEGDTCQLKTELGGNCTSSFQCRDFPFSNSFCLNNTCHAINSAVNDGCRVNEDCASRICSNGLCAASNSSLCVQGSCPHGSYCSDSFTCAPLLVEGAFCRSVEGFDSPCELGLTCGANGTCIPFFTVLEGENCLSDWECEIGFFCRKNISSNTTLPASSFAFIEGICTAEPLSPIFCSVRKDCALLGNADCVCSETGERRCEIFRDPQFPVISSPFSRDSFNSLVTCLRLNNCSSFSAAPDSCAQISCPNDMNCFLAGIETFGFHNNELANLNCSAPNIFTCPATSGNRTEVQQCLDQACCTALQNPNPVVGAGYLEFELSCLNGGLHCVENTGCRLCFNTSGTGPNEGNRPICSITPTPTCPSEACCEAAQIPNVDTGNGYLQFTDRCLNGGLHCVDNSGCEVCFNPAGSGPNLGNRPICERFGSGNQAAQENSANLLAYPFISFLLSIPLYI